MNKIATVIAAAALVAGMSGSASAQGLAGLGAGVTTGAVVGVTLAGLLIIAVVADDGTVTTTTAVAQ
tara:strand:- start:300 stop:500 length:201 start_codon:yes stop_codon:yes gene_type:complete